jgi:hypothetical protein
MLVVQQIVQQVVVVAVLRPRRENPRLRPGWCE